MMLYTRRLFVILFGVAAILVSSPMAKSETWPGEIILPEFPKPDPAHVFSELKFFDTSGSPIRVPKEDWIGARQQVSTNVEWQQWVAQQRTQVDDWMAKRHDKVGWIAGWHHNFVSPKDGTFLTFMTALF
jgi:oligo-alginate lyase